MNGSRRVGRLLTLVLLAVALAGCATTHVSAYLSRGIDLRQYHTYGWGPADTLSTGDPRLDNNRFFDERVRMQVEKHLASRGFEPAPPGTADLFVHYHAGITQRIDTAQLDPDGNGDAGRRSEVYDVGTLFIDLIDTRTSKLVWRGWAEGTLDGVIDQQEWMEERIDDAVTRILQKLPRGL
jgi:uncharacterized protein DUF4136